MRQSAIVQNKFICETQTAIFNTENYKFDFGNIEINSENFENGMIATKNIEFEVREISKSSETKSKRIGICTAQAKNLLLIQEGD